MVSLNLKIYFKTSASSTPLVDSTCDVSVTVNSIVKTLSSAFTYKAALTPTVTSVSPTRGGTGGGTMLTLTGTGFP